jgi:hypothetical protein
VFAIILLFRKKAIRSEVNSVANNQNKVVLTKEEYDKLLNRIKELEEQLKN